MLWLLNCLEEERSARSRPCTSLQLDYDRASRVTIAGMAARWGWSRNKVTRFLDEVGVVILYPETTSKKQNQKGQIAIQIRDRCGADNEQIKIIDNKGLADKKSRKRADTGQIAKHY